MDLQSVERLRSRGGFKWNTYPDDVLAAWVAEMDFGLAPPVAEALHAAIDAGEVGYPYAVLEEETATAACGFWSDRLGWEVGPSQVFPVPDVVEGLRRAIVHLTEPDSSVVLHTPVYYPFFSMVERAGRQLVDVPCQPDADGRYRLDLESIGRAFDGGAGCIVLCNPWNPTGRAFTRAEVEAVVELASSKGSRVIADEVHAPLVRGGIQHVVAATVDPSTVVTVTSASKAWNIPGLKCAQVVLSNSADIEIWTGYFTPDKVGVSSLGLVANAAAYRQGQEWLDEVTAQIDANRNQLEALLARHLPEVRFGPLEATYLAWLDFRPYGLDEPAAFFLDRARVALSAGAPFGAGGVGHARLNFATAPEILSEIVERMAHAVSERLDG